MITTNWSDDGGQLLVHAEDPAGPWSEPVRIPSAMGIDPDLAWDDDGTCLMTYAGFGPDGGEGIVQSAIDPLTGEVLTERRWLWSGTGGKFPEGPHLYRIGEWWYLLIAEGGTERGHAVTIARSPVAAGTVREQPGQPADHAPRHRRAGAEHRPRRPGRAARTAAGRSSTTACRARGSSPEWHVLGRETFADEVVWADGWPVLTGHVEPACRRHRSPRARPARAAAVLGGGEPLAVGGRRRDGRRLAGDRGGHGEPVFVGRRQEHLYARVRARLDVDGTGGLSVRIDPAARGGPRGAGRPRAGGVGGRRHPARARRGGPARRRRAGDPAAAGRDAAASSSGAVRTSSSPGSSDGDRFTELGRVDGRYLSTEVAGGMTGRMLGVAVSDGSVLVRSFEYVGADDPAALS